MYDNLLVEEILSQILTAISRIGYRFKPVKNADYFLDSEQGLEKLDSICMALITIGESLKNLDKITGKELLSKYSAINWKRIMGMRDIISHHYFDLDAEIVFDVCQNKLIPLKSIIEKMLNDISSQ